MNKKYIRIFNSNYYIYSIKLGLKSLRPSFRTLQNLLILNIYE